MFTDIVSRETQDTMEVPFLSLSKSPRFTPIRYNANGVEVTVSGGEPHGIANIFDWDLIIWLLSQIREAKDLGKPVSRKIRFSRWNYLKDARRHTSGDEYRRLESAIARLKHTTVSTTIRAKGRRTIMFNWLEFVDIERDDRGYLRDVTVVLPEWLFDAVCDHRLVLSLHRDYFLLKGGIERWLYRIVRKGAGDTTWKWRVRTLYERSGTTRPYKYFAADLRKIVKRNDLLDYKLKIAEENGQQFLTAKRIRETAKATKPDIIAEEPVRFLRLSTSAYEKAKAAAPGFDVYALEQDWRHFNEQKQTVVKNPDAAFIAFCKSHAKKNPIPAR